MKIAIIEDEIPAQRLMKDMLEKIDPKIEIVGCFKSVKSTVEWFSNNPHPDIALFDIQLADGLSFQIFDQVKIQSMVIFTTAFDEYTLQAFKVNSLDYLLKPIDQDEMQQALGKYETYRQRFFSEKNSSINFHDIVSAIQNAQPNYRKRFLIHTNESFFHLPVEQIAWFYSQQKITFAVTNDQHEYPIEFSLENLKEQLNPDEFFKINRNYIIRINAIKRIHSYFQGKLVLDVEPSPSEKIIVGKDKAHEFRQWLNR